MPVAIADANVTAIAGSAIVRHGDGFLISSEILKFDFYDISGF